jgi:hypothetical protein
MVSEREVVGLLYRADWTKLALSGTVTSAEPVVDPVIMVQSDEPLSWPWRREDDAPPPPPPVGLFEQVLPPWLFGRAADEAREARRGQASGPSWAFAPEGEGAARTLSVAPGRRFRAEGADGTWAVGSDGTRMWYWLRDRPAGSSVRFGFAGFDEPPRPPYRKLLVPSWLLTRYSLVLDGEVTVCGRAGVRVLGTLRKVAEETDRVNGRLGLFAPIPRWLGEHWNEVEAVVDAELGILLRYSRRSGDEPPAVTEFSSLDVGEPAEAAWFSAPAGSVFGGDKGGRTRGPGGRPADGAADASLGDALGEALGAAGKEAAKTVAGLAAGGLGALIRYAPRRQRVDPFARATAEAADPEAQMPTDEPAPDAEAVAAAAAASGLADEVAPSGLTDEVLHLVYRGGLTVPPLRATLHQWFDAGALLAAVPFDKVPQSARGAGFGGVGFLVDAVRDTAREVTPDVSHEVSTVAMRGWDEYRIDLVRPVADPDRPAHGLSRHQALTIVSDGVEQWQVYSDRVLRGSAAPPPGDLAGLVDAAWLLDSDLDLSVGTEVLASGRRAYRIEARYQEDTQFAANWWQRLFFPAVAVVDAETGLVLRLTRFKGGRPMWRQELRDLTELDAGADFAFTPPDGVPVYDRESPQDESGPKTRSWFWNPPG